MKSAILFLLGMFLTTITGAHAEPDNRCSITDQAIPILLYHSIAEESGNPLIMPPDRFQRQMAYLRDMGYHPLFFGELRDWKKGRLPQKSVIITLDDGYADNYAAAFPVLKRTGMKATIFAITGKIGHTGYLTWEQLRAMELFGFVDTQSHTVSHPDLTKLNAGEKSRELLRSREAIHRYLGHWPLAFAYPYGKYDDASVQAVRFAGYRYAVTGEPGFAQPRQGLLKLHRMLISSEMSMEEFHSLFP
mgnify:CR=1 FL=1